MLGETRSITRAPSTQAGDLTRKVVLVRLKPKTYWSIFFYFIQWDYFHHMLHLNNLSF